MAIDSVGTVTSAQQQVTPSTGTQSGTPVGEFARQYATAMMSESSWDVADAADPTSMLMNQAMTGLFAEMPTDDVGMESMLLLMCAMMASGSSESNELAVRLMAAVSTMKNPEKLRRKVMDSDYADTHPEVLDRVNAEVFRAEESDYPYEAWKPCVPELTGDQTNRSADVYNQIINQFDVEGNDRYLNNKQGKGDTYCNIYMWDVTSAMGAEIPHYVNEAGEPVAYENRREENAHALNANAIFNWLANNGETYGWRKVSPEEAQMHANAGHPAVTAWRNPQGHGHVQVVCPSADGAYNEETGVTVSQAGSKRLQYAVITDVFKGSALENVTYYVHE